MRATIDGEEARLGNAEFCGVSHREQQVAGEGKSSFIVFAHPGRTATISIRQTLQLDAAAVAKALAARGLRLIVLGPDLRGKARIDGCLRQVRQFLLIPARA